VVAIGDVHGCATLLNQVLQLHLRSGAEQIVLGDLLDRVLEPGGDRGVIDIVLALQDDPQRHSLAGGAPGARAPPLAGGPAHHGRPRPLSVRVCRRASLGAAGEAAAG
jgi:hypothetical protein